MRVSLRRARLVRRVPARRAVALGEARAFPQMARSRRLRQRSGPERRRPSRPSRTCGGTRACRAYARGMVIFGPSAAGALVKLRCPKCGTVQARARGPEETPYACRECHASFTRAEGTIPEELPRRPR